MSILLSKKRSVWVVFTVIILFIAISFFSLKYTGFAVVTSDAVYNQQANLSITSSAEYPLQIHGLLKSISLDGSVSGNALVYLQQGGNEYLVLDSTKLEARQEFQPEIASTGGPMSLTIWGGASVPRMRFSGFSSH